MTRRIAWDCWGWAQIADALGVSERTARRYGGRSSAQNPLPIKRIGGMVVASRDDLIDWIERESRAA